MFQPIVECYNDIVYNKGDPRVQNLVLMRSPLFTILLCVAYLLIVLIGPKLMKNKKPYILQGTITAYNILQVFCSAYIFYECIAIGWLNNFSIFKCQSVDFSENPNSAREMRVMHLYFLSKFTEFADTIFFVLRKKNSHISFLHVYHHASMPVYIWMATKYYPGGSMTVIAFVNSIIHVLMYLYYLLAGLGPQMQPYLWWKKYLTVLQLIQFVTGTGHFVIVILSGSDCNISKQFCLIYVAIGVFFYILFSSFYKKSYTKTSINEKQSINNSSFPQGQQLKFANSDNNKIK